jgi:hypothetical protein
MRRVLSVAAGAALACVLSVATVPVAASAGMRDDNATVCAAAAKHVTEGLDQFVNQMKTVSTQAQQGDLTGAEASVKQAGATLTTVSANLTADAQKADDPKVKAAITDVAAEFQNLGGSLNGLTDLQRFDTTKLDTLATSMSTACGMTPGPLPTITPSS